MFIKAKHRSVVSDKGTLGLSESERGLSMQIFGLLKSNIVPKSSVRVPQTSSVGIRYVFDTALTLKCLYFIGIRISTSI